MIRIKKTIEYGLYLLVFSLPFQTRWIISQGVMAGWPYEFGTLSLYATDILLLILIVLNAWVEIKNEKLNTRTCNFGFEAPSQASSENDRTTIPFVWWLIAGIELATFISIFFAPNKIIAIQFYFRLLLGIGLFWVITSANYNLNKLINLFMASAAVQAVFGIWQFFIQATFANKYLGLAKHLPTDIGASVITAADGVRWLRAYGSLDHPNIFGGMMAIALLMLIMQLTRQNHYTESGKSAFGFSPLYYLLSVVLVSGLFFSFSRAAWIGFGFGLFVLILFYIKNKSQTSNLLNTFKDGSVVIIVFILLSGIYYNLISVRTANNTVTENKSINDRLQSYQISSQIIKDNWLAGSGAGNYGFAVKNGFNNLDYNSYQPVHNIFLLVYSEIGILGLISFCCLIIFLTWQLIKMGEGASISIVITMLTIFMLDHWWWSLHFGLLFLWLLLGALYLKSSDHIKKININNG